MTPPTQLRWVRARIGLVAAIMTGLFGAIAWKAWALQIGEGARMSALGRAQYLKEMEVPAPRGTILDRNGVELAVSVAVDSVWANPRAVQNRERTAERLASALELDVRQVAAKLERDGYFAWIQRRVRPEDAKRVRELGLPGVEIAPEPRRFYPGRELAGTLLGFAGMEGKGLDGLELSLDETLRGKATAVPALRDARGKLVLQRSDRPVTAAGSVVLTIDRFVQWTAEQALQAAVTEHQAKAGIVVVLDPRTGEVLAMAASPSFDPNAPERRGEARNRAVTDEFEPGSVMKVFSIAAAVDAGVVTPNDHIDIEGGRLTIGGHTILDTHKGENVVSVTEIMKFSSNVGATKIARKLGRDRLHDAYERMGFGRRTGIELPGERSGRLRPAARWGEIGLATHSYGYGLTVTPLQLATALAAVANGGMAMKPTIVKRVLDGEGRVMREHVPQSERLFTERAAHAVTAMLKTVMEKGGTAEKVVIPGFAGAGKTGTAHKLDPVTRRYARDLYLSSFMGFVPADDPRLVIVVMIDEPKGGKYYGGAVAGPVFAKVATETLKYLGVAGDPEPPAPTPAAMSSSGSGRLRVPVPGPDELRASPGGDVRASPEDEVPPAGPTQPIVMIPDFSGMSLAEALAAARAAGVRIEVAGSGRAIRQFPAPGRAMKSITCRVTFNPG